MQKNIVAFAPYGNWLVHHQVDAVLGKALELRGASFFVILCDGVFENCPNAGMPYQAEACRSCANSGRQWFAQFGLKSIPLSSLITQRDIAECQEWALQLKEEDFLQATFEGGELGKWVYAGVCSYFFMGKPPLSDPRVALTYRVFLYNAALLQRAIKRGLDALQPQHTICYAGTLAAYRVFLETCRQRGIPALVHERGPLDDTFIFADSDYYGRMAGREESLKAWDHVPLSEEECQAAKWHILERELGKNLNRGHFYRMPPVQGSLRSALRIPYDAPLIAVFTQSDWELGMARGYVERLFDQAIDGVRQILDNLVASNPTDVYWVFRLHPNMVGPSWTDFVFLEQMIAQGLLMPQHVRVIMPTERITSYQLIWEADAALSFGSTVGAEALVRGLFVASSVDNLTVKINGVEKIQSIEDYSNALSRVMQKTKQLSLENLRLAYRRVFY